MIRSAKIRLNDANTGKLETLTEFIVEYTRVAQVFVDKFWGLPRVPRLFSKDTTSSIDTWLSARMLQVCAKQASAIVRGTRKKLEQREWRYQELVKVGNVSGARKLRKIIDAHPIGKPELTDVRPELDSRFVNVIWTSDISFDGWLVLGSIGRGIRLAFPIRRNAVFNKWASKGVLKPGVRLIGTTASFMFEIPDVPKKATGTILGIDVGYKKVVATSTGVVSIPNIHGWTLPTITSRISARVPGSKGFQRAVALRDNYIHWTINQLNLDGVHTVKIEAIKDLRRGVRASRTLSHWTYPNIFEKIGRVCEERGVRVVAVSPTYTSQRCFSCGWVSKSNRKGEGFRCRICGYVADADINAASNIALDLPALDRSSWSPRNREGFYWKPCQESVVPDAPRP